MADCDVLIVGAGPTGLVLALWLTRQGARVRIVDRTAAPGTTSRALAVQARTLELYRQLDLTDEILRRGHRTSAVNLWVRAHKAARIPFNRVGDALTPYPFLLIFPQDEHEALLVDRLSGLGVTVERRTELIGFEQDPNGVVARLGCDGEAPRTVRAAFIAGCDGARSRVRDICGAAFPGGTYRRLFYVADVEAAGPVMNGELHIDLDEADFLGVFPLAGDGRARLIGAVRDDRVSPPDALRFDDINSRAIKNMGVSVRRLNWFSTYHVHHRVSGAFRHGRAFLLGDAAHIHSPAGGQGMNTGIGDAINLAWKLAAVVQGRAPDSLLDSYETERIGFARRLVATTDRLFSFVTAEGRVAKIARTRLAPLLLPRIAAFRVAREYLFRTVSQITLNYRHGPLSAGTAGKIRGGDRMPWAETAGSDNFGFMTEIGWRAHVYGAARAELAEGCARLGLPLSVFAWRPGHARAGLARDAAYLIRPDAYVAVAEPSGSPLALERYFGDQGITLSRPSVDPPTG